MTRRFHISELYDDIMEELMPHRYVCDVLSEMRDMVKTMRFDRAKGLIEEVQTLVNRMEARLYEMGDKERYEKRLVELKREKKEKNREIEKLEMKIDALKEKKGDLEYEMEVMERPQSKGQKILAMYKGKLKEALDILGETDDDNSVRILLECKQNLKKLGVGWDD